MDKQTELAQMDPLTGVVNSRHFRPMLSLEIAKAQRYGRPITLAFFDIDNSKYINDNMGHGIGDDLLQSVAKSVLGNIRSTDVTARLGGDEFAILLPETTEEQSRIVFTKIRDVLLKTVRDKGWPVTFSFGVGHMQCRIPGCDRADQACGQAYVLRKEERQGQGDL